MLFAVAQLAEHLVDLTMPRGAVELGNRNLRLGALPGGEVEPNQRYGYLYALGVGWMLFGVVGWASMIILSLIGSIVAGRGGQYVGVASGALIIAVSVGGIFATVPYFTWAWWARILARRGGTRSAADEARIKSAVRRAHPSDRVILTVQIIAVL
jgi:hypothetical protein